MLILITSSFFSFWGSLRTKNPSLNSKVFYNIEIGGGGGGGGSSEKQNL